MGNVVADPELRYTPQGTPVTTFRLAMNRAYRDAQGDLKEDTQFVNVVAWSKTAELTAQYINKGRGVLVEGRLNTREYDKAGERRFVTEVIADRVVFLGGPGGAPPAPAEPAADAPDDVPYY